MMVAVAPGAAASEDETDPGTIDEILAQAPIPAAEANTDLDDGPENDDRMEFVRSGLIRVWIGGVRYRLRRPFFGEFRDFRLALEDVNEEVSDASDQAIALARSMTREAKTIDEDTMDPDEWLTMRRSYRERSRGASTKLRETVDAARLGWWEKVWATVGVDGRPDEWPSWVVDTSLANAMIVHWRSSPQGRG